MVASTPGIELVRNLAERAKQRPEGLIIDYLVKDYGTLRNAHFAARAFQSAYSSMRAKARAKAYGHKDNFMSPNTEFKGPYDYLACYKRERDDGEGYYIILAPGSGLDIAMHVRDKATGDTLDDYKPTKMRVNNLMNYWLRKAAENSTHHNLAPNKHKHFRNPWNEEEIAFMWENGREILIDLYGGFHFPLPDGQSSVVETIDPNYIANTEVLKPEDAANLTDKEGSVFDVE